MTLQGKRVVVTAAAGGIGAAIASAFAGEGARLAICDLNGEGIETLAEPRTLLIISCASSKT